MQTIERKPLIVPRRNRNTDAEGDLLLRPGESVVLNYRHDGRTEVRHSLRLVGEAGTNWQERRETLQPMIWYRLLEDALTREPAWGDERSLHIHGRGETFSRYAWFKLPGGRLPKNQTSLEFNAWVKTRNLSGRVSAALEIYHHRKGRHPDDIYDPADRLLELRAPEGTQDWALLRKRLTGLHQIAAILVRVGGAGFTGEAFFSTPRLVVPGEGNLIQPYDTRNWIGENLSRKEWPEFFIRVNGQKIFRGPVFCCITRDPDVEFPIPGRLLRPGDNRIEITLEADYPTAPGYCLRRAEILKESARAFEVVAVPEYGAGTIPILLETNQPNVTIQSSMGTREKLTRPGLHVLKFPAGELTRGIKISDGARQEVIDIKRAVEKTPDGVLVGTGDAVYVPQTMETFRRYLKWYFTERIGNFITFRPVYRWCGSREFSPQAWTFALSLLNRLGTAYALMVDGRELPGKKVCPPNTLLAGPNYKGRQSHEADGAFKYWGGYEHENPFYCELFQRSAEPDGIFPGVRPMRVKDKFFPFHANNLYADMKSGAEYFVHNLRQLSKTATRHTGPSALFRYFYQAGFKFLGAEQMYGAEDVILAALRGASRAYGKSEFGAHLAVQWSSVPLNTPEHFRRYFLSLACCYLQGVTQINTEEGLYRMESDFAREDRFGPACTGHRKTHAEFRRFVETHSRRGAMHVPIGILQGRYCSWTCFARGPAWDQADPSMRFGPPEESFDLLNVFYPRCVLDGIYRYPCPPKPQGWYSGTPYGPVDLLPVEASQKIFDQYRVLAFLGWNTFNEGDFSRLLAFVRRGGNLLLARPHVSTNVRRCEPATVPNSPALRELLGPAIKAAPRVVRNVGKGRVIYYGQDLYPADPAIRKLYERDLRTLAGNIITEERSRGWIVANEDVDFAVYDHGETRTIYLLNIRWWDTRTAGAKLLLGSEAFNLAVPFGTIGVVTVGPKFAVYSRNPDTEVTNINEQGFTFQADGRSSLQIFQPDRKTKTIPAIPGHVVV